MNSRDTYRSCGAASPYDRWFTVAVNIRPELLPRLRALSQQCQDVYAMMNRSTDPWGRVYIGAMEMAWRMDIDTPVVLSMIRQLVAVGLLEARIECRTGMQEHVRIAGWDEDAYKDIMRLHDLIGYYPTHEETRK